MSVPSSDAVRIDLPSGKNRHLHTALVCFVVDAAISAPVSAFQSLSLPSVAPDTRRVPSGEKAHASIPSPWGGVDATRVPSIASQIVTVSSPLATAMRWPSGDQQQSASGALPAGI